MSTGDDSPASRLELANAHFVEELQRLSKVLGRRTAGDALLSYEEGHLRIRIGGAEMAVPAQGQWQGQARVSAAWIRAFAKVPPAQDPLVFEVKAGRMRIANSSIACHWQVPGAATIEVPIGLGLQGRLRIASAHTEADLQKSGMAR